MIYTKDEKKLIESLVNNGGEYQSVLERTIGRSLGVRYVHSFNSMASAHLVALLALTSPKLKSRALGAGDEVILSSINPPSVISSILQTGATPVFVDISISSYSPTPLMYSGAITENTKAIVATHVMGRSMGLDSLQEIAEQNNLWVVEICDGVSGEYGHENLGTFGSISCGSVGNSGIVLTNNSMLHTILLSMKNSGEDFISHVGLTLMPTEIEAGIAYLRFLQIDTVSEIRNKNWEYLHELFATLSGVFTLPSFPLDSPHWTGFLLTLKPDLGVSLDEMENYLLENGILIGRRKCRSVTQYSELMSRGRVADQTPKADFVHNNGFYLSLLETRHEYIRIFNSIVKFREIKHGR